MRTRASELPGARRISPEHRERLRAIVLRAGSPAKAARLLGRSVELVEDGQTGRKWRPSTAAELEAAIDRLEPPERATG